MAVSENPTPREDSGLDSARCEQWLAAALRGQPEHWPGPSSWTGAIDDIADAAIYHGVAGLLADMPDVAGAWPEPLVARLTRQARAQAMWELRHREVLDEVLAELDGLGIRSLLMKGTAIAYDLYANPAARSRGDTDLLVAAADLGRSQAILARLGFARGTGDGLGEEFANQQSWVHTSADGGAHAIDLHWQVMNAPALRTMLPVEECLNQSRALPRLSRHARAMDRARLLLHTCLHRAMHRNAPYFVGQATYYGSGRLVWTNDIHLLCQALDREQWSLFCRLAEEWGVAGVCLDGLRQAQAVLATPIPGEILHRLDAASASDGKFAHFVPSRALARAWQDVRAVAGMAPKLRYAWARLVPRADFLRAKYPGMAGYPLPLLYLRRMVGVVRRSGGSGNADAG